MATVALAAAPETDTQYTEGEVEIDGNICNKISLKSDVSRQTYFYLDADSGLLYQKEDGQYYNDSFKLFYKYNYTYSYSYGTVTDDDILKFDISNYSDFTVVNN